MEHICILVGKRLAATIVQVYAKAVPNPFHLARNSTSLGLRASIKRDRDVLCRQYLDVRSLPHLVTCSLFSSLKFIQVYRMHNS